MVDFMGLIGPLFRKQSVCRIALCGLLWVGMGCSGAGKRTMAQREVSPGSPEAIVQAQLDHYNNRDLDAFLTMFSDSIKVYSPPETLRMAGKEALRAGYAELFEQAPDLHASITGRLVQGRFVVDQEVVTGLPGGRTLEAVALYEVKDSAITKLWMLTL